MLKLLTKKRPKKMRRTPCFFLKVCYNSQRVCVSVRGFSGIKHQPGTANEAD
jgi:hypothetical protein